MTEPSADQQPGETAPSRPASVDEDRWPIGFMLTLVMVGGYLAYRLIQGVVLFFEWVF